MSVNKIKLNKFVLYVSSIAIALFGVLYSFGEVKAETFYLTEEEVKLYYPLNDSCNSALNKGDNLTLLNAGGDYAISWTENIFSGGLKVLGTGDTNINKSSGCYGSSGYTLDTADGDEFTYIFTIYNPSQPTSSAIPIYFGDGNRVFGEIDSNGKIKFFWVWDAYNQSTYITTDNGIINFDGNNRVYQIAFRGTWSSSKTIGGDKRILVNGVDETTVFEYYSSKNTMPYNNYLDKIYIGHSATDSNGYNGEIGEVIVLNTKIHDDDLEILRTNSLNSMFGGGEELLPDPDTQIYGYFNFDSNYSCFLGSTCIIRYRYNQNYIPSDTNTIYLYDNNDNLVASSTIESFTEMGKNSGESRITFDVATTTPVGKYYYVVQASAEYDNNSWVWGTTPIISFYESDINDDYVVEFFTGFDDDVFTDLDCSSGNWWTNLTCNVGKKSLQVLNSFSDFFKNIFTKYLWKLANVFPFNIPIAIKQAWVNSETVLLSNDLIFLDLSDVDGNVSGTFPKEWLSTSTDLTFPIFSKTFIANSSQKALDLFDNFKKFTKWLQLFAFSWGILLFSRKIIDDLQGLEISEYKGRDVKIKDDIK